jgi:myosin heavy subunit
MEEFRDERLSRIMSWMQSWARGYLTRKTFKKLQEQRMALTVVQRSLRRYLKLRTWPWWKLWQKVKPLLNASRVEDQIAVSIEREFVSRFNCGFGSPPSCTFPGKYF